MGGGKQSAARHKSLSVLERFLRPRYARGAFCGALLRILRNGLRNAVRDDLSSGWPCCFDSGSPTDLTDRLHCDRCKLPLGQDTNQFPAAHVIDGDKQSELPYSEALIQSVAMAPQSVALHRAMV